jgi:hypothetical protein
VVERPQVSNRCFTSPFHLRLCWDWITWDRVGPLGDCSPRLCRLRTDRLPPASKYWMYRSHAGDMDLVSLVDCPQQKLGFSPLLHWLLWERSWVWTHVLVSRHDVGWVGSPSSREKWIYSNLLTTMWKVAVRWPCEIRMVWDRTQTEHGMYVACWLDFPCRVYIDSNRRGSRIWVTACLRLSAHS